MHCSTKGGHLPIKFSPIPSPVMPSVKKIPIAAARSAFTVAEAAPKTERAMWTSSRAEWPVIELSGHPFVAYSGTPWNQYPSIYLSDKLHAHRHTQYCRYIQAVYIARHSLYIDPQREGNYQSISDPSHRPLCHHGRKCPLPPRAQHSQSPRPVHLSYWKALQPRHELGCLSTHPT